MLAPWQRAMYRETYDRHLWLSRSKTPELAKLEAATEVLHILALNVVDYTLRGDTTAIELVKPVAAYAVRVKELARQDLRARLDARAAA